MGILRAIGLIIAIIAIKIMMPDVFSGLEATLVEFFEVTREIMGQLPDASHTAMVYPHAVR